MKLQITTMRHFREQGNEIMVVIDSPTCAKAKAIVPCKKYPGKSKNASPTDDNIKPAKIFR